MPHPYQSSINLLRLALNSIPAAFPADRKKIMADRLAELEGNQQVTQAEIDAAMIDFGKEIWPYHEAYEEFYRIHGENREREVMLTKLSERARQALEQFLANGGKVDDVRVGKKIEKIFDAEVRAEIIEAELEAHDVVHEEMEKKIAGDGTTEFNEYLENHKNKLKVIEEQIAALRALAERSEQWAPEILDKVKTFEEAFAYVERGVNVDDVTHEVQYYIDIMGLEQ